MFNSQKTELFRVEKSRSNCVKFIGRKLFIVKRPIKLCLIHKKGELFRVKKAILQFVFNSQEENHL